MALSSINPSAPSDDVVDVTLIRWLLALTPWERLKTLEEIHARRLSSHAELVDKPDVIVEINSP